ncbi:bifunctional adenosylcobinamide kinase/adenosylcobinamide-phosphate guanylyltransferase [Phormidium sp. FACHB-1136]|uniref:bifunctional adenosylcobinamide kinase/adenosylcobinamide-phosphate guanylyltransferase n=1 Tax=Phormidium sp. FACHB-1136 TaxID=2692848 RepID=UPI0016872247|nr:bifunctional adenosylcobinamide kinase/adenosylcobinamide-phosphate guanylyltransferase [Phormidium sp. FACHB-1136]
MKQIVVVTGPTRSGKSEWAETLAQQSQQEVVYVATSAVDPNDQEWQARLEQHRQRRPADWRLWEVPVGLSAAILAGKATDCLLVDSLGTWLANELGQDEAQWQETVASVIASVQQTAATVIFVAEETGWGVVPAYPAGRQFRDRLGQLTRQLGAVADALYLVVAGYAVDLRQVGRAVDTHPSVVSPISQGSRSA